MAATVFSVEETETFASAARDAINARLKSLPEGVLADFWEIVAKGYNRADPPKAETAMSVGL
ncbi:hypothetical protein ASF57_24090 [Methylobacterium sp. Leaf117]|nr:hypothetical protein ASF57_24090 [Methylobacterium sp. Leaf117]